MRQISHISGHPQLYARICGLMYLMVIVLGGFSEGFVSARIIVPGDMTATAHNIVADHRLWNLGVIADLFVVVVAVPQMWIEYLLLRPVSKDGALLAVLLNVVSLAVESVSKLFLILVLPILSNNGYHLSLGQSQTVAMADLALCAHDIAFNITLIFFGMTCLVNGYLIFRSGYLPRLVGILMQLAGLSYLIACFSALFAPRLSAMLSPAILLPALIGEASLCLWLLIMGVNHRRWQQLHQLTA